MAPTILQGTPDQGTGTSATPTLPGGISAGDVGLLVLTKDDDNNDVSTPSGHSLIADSGAPGHTGTMQTVAFADTLVGSESGGVTTTWSGSEDFVSEYLVVTGTTGIDVTDSDYDAANRSSASVSATVTNDGSLAVVICGSEDARDTYTPPDGSWSSLTRLSEGSGVTGAAQQIFYKEVDSGSTGTLTFGASAGQEFQLTLLVFAPEADGDAEANPSGVAGTGSPGTVTATGTANVTPTGVTGTGGVGTVTVDSNTPVSVTGVAGTGSPGDVTVTGTANVTPTGVTGTGAAGDVSPTGTANVTPDGVEGTGSPGDVAVDIGAQADPTGVEGTGSAGTTDATGSANVTPTGVSGTGLPGSVTVTADANVNITGVSATGAAGDVSAVSGTVVDVTGVSATGAAGDTSATGDANITPDGVFAQGQAGNVSAETDTTETQPTDTHDDYTGDDIHHAYSGRVRRTTTSREERARQERKLKESIRESLERTGGKNPEGQEVPIEAMFVNDDEEALIAILAAM